MFAGINICGSLGLVSCLGTRIMFAGYLFLRFKDDCEICQINPSQTLMNLQYSVVNLAIQWFTDSIPACQHV